MDNMIDRRRFLGFSLPAVTMLLPRRGFSQNPAGQTSPAALSAPVPSPTAAAVFIGAWEIPPPALVLKGQDQPSQPANQQQKKGNVITRAGKAAVNAGKAGVEAARQSANVENFAHLYVKLVDQGQEYYIHGVPVDPVSGQPRDFDDLKNAKLRIVLWTKEEHDAFYRRISGKWKKQYAAMSDIPLEDTSGRSAATTMAMLLDMARAVNDRQFPYLTTALDRKPASDGNAAAAALLGALNVCGADNNCAVLESLHKGYRVEGVLRQLPKEITLRGMYQELAEAGDPVPELVRTFKLLRVQNAPPAAQPALTIK